MNEEQILAEIEAIRGQLAQLDQLEADAIAADPRAALRKESQLQALQNEESQLDTRIGQLEDYDNSSFREFGVRAGDMASSIVGEIGGAAVPVATSSALNSFLGPTGAAISTVASIPAAGIGATAGGRQARSLWRDWIEDKWGAPPGEGMENQLPSTGEIFNEEDRFYQDPSFKVEAGTNTLFAGIGPVKRVLAGRGAFKDPVTQAATRQANLDLPVDKQITSAADLRPTNVKNLKAQELLAKQEPDELVGGKLGLNDRATSTARGLATDFRDNLDIVKRSGLLTTVDDVRKLGPAAKGIADNVYQQKLAVLDRYNSATFTSKDIYDFALKVKDPASGLSYIDKANNLASSIVPDEKVLGEEMLNFVQRFKPKGGNYTDTFLTNLKTPSSDPGETFTPRQFAEFITGFNKARRARGEFANSEIAKSLTDSVAANVQEEAFAKNQNFISDFLFSKLPQGDGDRIKNFNRIYAGMSALERIGNARAESIRAGLAERGAERVMQSSGPSAVQQGAMSAATRDRSGVMRSIADAVMPGVTDELPENLLKRQRVTDSFGGSMQGAQDVVTLKNGFLDLEPFGESATQNAGIGLDYMLNPNTNPVGSMGVAMSGDGIRALDQLMGEENQPPQELPRTIANLNENTIPLLGQKILEGYGPQMEPIVTKLNSILLQAIKNNNKNAIAAAYGAFATAFPSVFEGGFGITGADGRTRVYNQMERDSILQRLREDYRAGKIPALLLAKQEQNFTDKDSYELVDPSLFSKQKGPYFPPEKGAKY